VTRYLAVDLGDRRTGLAAGDDETGLVDPLEVLEVPREKGLLEAVLRRVAEHGPDVVVIGLPYNMDGTEGPRAAISRAFGAALAEAAGVRIEYADERLTSFAAEGRLAGRGHTRRQKKKRLDAIAAAELLRDHLGLA